MKKIYPLSLLLLLLLSFTSCWKDEWVDWKYDPTLLKLSGLLSADSVMTIHVLPLDDEAVSDWDSIKANTHVYLWVNGDSHGEMRRVDWTDTVYGSLLSSYYYTSDYIPKEGDVIRVAADCKGYTSISAENRIPSVVPIEDFAYTINCDTSDYSVYKDIDLDLDFRLTFRDKAATADYYAYNTYFLMKDSLGSFPALNGFYFYREKESCDPIIKLRPNTIDYIFDGDETYVNFFDDSDISGKSYELTHSLSGNLGLYNYSGPMHSLSDTVYVCVEFVSFTQADYFSNIASWASNGKLLDGLVEIGLADPIEEYSNVEGGCGLLGVQNASRRMIRFVPADLHASSEEE